MFCHGNDKSKWAPHRGLLNNLSFWCEYKMETSKRDRTKTVNSVTSSSLMLVVWCLPWWTDWSTKSNICAVLMPFSALSSKTDYDNRIYALEMLCTMYHWFFIKFVAQDLHSLLLFTLYTMRTTTHNWCISYLSGSYPNILCIALQYE